MVSGAGAICAGAAGAAEGVTAGGDGAGGGAVVAAAEAAGALIAEVSEDPLQSSLGRMASFFEK